MQELCRVWESVELTSLRRCLAEAVMIVHRRLPVGETDLNPLQISEAEASVNWINCGI